MGGGKKCAAAAAGCFGTNLILHLSQRNVFISLTSWEIGRSAGQTTDTEQHYKEKTGAKKVIEDGIFTFFQSFIRWDVLYLQMGLTLNEG